MAAKAAAKIVTKMAMTKGKARGKGKLEGGVAAIVLAAGKGTRMRSALPTLVPPNFITSRSFN